MKFVRYKVSTILAPQIIHKFSSTNSIHILCCIKQNGGKSYLSVCVFFSIQLPFWEVEYWFHFEFQDCGDFKIAKVSCIFRSKQL